MELLSAEWCAAWTVAATGLEPPSVPPFSVDEVLEGRQEQRKVRLTYDGTAFALAPLSADDGAPNATLTLSEETAQGLASGALSPAEALSRGLVRVSGDLTALIASQEALAAVTARIPRA